MIPTLLAIYPGLVIVSPWWGQYESPYVLFVVLSLIALNKDKPIRAWLMFAIAIMFKQPAVVIGPLLLVLSFRRFGWKPTLIGLGICAGLSAVLFIPFILGSGFGPALSPYLGAGDVYPFLTNNAYNFWYAVAFMRTGQAVPLFSPAYGDKMLLIGGFSAKFSGFLMFGLYVLIIMVLAWKHYQRRQEFLWATALFMAFFLFPTQVHERYIYPAGVLTILAAAQDRRMWWVAAGVAITFTFNVLGVAIPYRHNWPIGAWGVQEFALPTALFNISMFVVVTWMLVRQSQDNSSDDVVPLGYVR